MAILHRNLLELKAVTQENLVGTVAVVAQLGCGGVIGITQAENLLGIARLLLVLHGVFKTDNRSDCVAWTPGQSTPQHVVPQHVHVDICNGGIEIGFGQNVAAQDQVIPIDLVVISAHEVKVACGLNAQLAEGDLSNVRR